MLLEDSPTRTRAFRRELVGTHLQTFDNARDAVQWLAENTPDLAFLDYDLDQYGGISEDVGDGIEVVRYITLHAHRFARTRFVVHSLNPLYAPAMAAQLRTAGLQVSRIPHVWSSPAAMAALVTGRA